jgi:hypothetical protein
MIAVSKRVLYDGIRVLKDDTDMLSRLLLLSISTVLQTTPTHYLHHHTFSRLRRLATPSMTSIAQLEQRLKAVEAAVSLAFLSLCLSISVCLPILLFVYCLFIDLCALYSIISDFCSLLFAVCSLLYAACSLLSTLCPLLSALCPLLSALCPLPS